MRNEGSGGRLGGLLYIKVSWLAEEGEEAQEGVRGHLLGVDQKGSGVRGHLEPNHISLWSRYFRL